MTPWDLILSIHHSFIQLGPNLCVRDLICLFINSSLLWLLNLKATYLLVQYIWIDLHVEKGFYNHSILLLRFGHRLKIFIVALSGILNTKCMFFFNMRGENIYDNVNCLHILSFAKKSISCLWKINIVLTKISIREIRGVLRKELKLWKWKK